MKARIQEALRRRNRRGDEGFTLIELLVVILIIAILAAVGIVALLSALNSGKKSAAKTTMRNAISAVKSTQTGLGSQDFTGITVTGTNAGSLTAEEPDLTWQTALPGATQNTNVVSVPILTTNRMVLVTRSANGNCFYTDLDANGGTGYASVVGAAGSACPAAPGDVNPSAATVWATATWFKDQTTGWRAG